MNHKDSERLSQAVEQYLLQRIEQGYRDTDIISQCKILQDFQIFVEKRVKGWDAIFTLEILQEFMHAGKTAVSDEGRFGAWQTSCTEKNLSPAHSEKIKTDITGNI